MLTTGTAASFSSVLPYRRYPNGELHERIVYLLLKDCRKHYFEQPDAFHMDGRIYPHCYYHYRQSFFHKNYKLFIRQLAIDVMLYGRGFLVQRKRGEIA